MRQPVRGNEWENGIGCEDGQSASQKNHKERERLGEKERKRNKIKLFVPSFYLTQHVMMKMMKIMICLMIDLMNQSLDGRDGLDGIG